MYKILSIGDIHGETFWRKTGDIDWLLKADEDSAGYGSFEPEYDYYVFIGDYVDSFTKNNVEIFHNLKEIIRFKELYPSKVVLLWGNHDVQYSKFSNGYCSGYRPEAEWDLKELFNTKSHLFKLAFQVDNYLWTHAGVHTGWYKFRFNSSYTEMTDEEEDYLDKKNLATELNYAFERKLLCLFDVGRHRGGMHQVGGPLWLDSRPGSLKPLKGYHQIVGHTQRKTPKYYHIDKDTSYTVIDTNNENAFNITTINNE